MPNGSGDLQRRRDNPLATLGSHYARTRKKSHILLGEHPPRLIHDNFYRHKSPSPFLSLNAVIKGLPEKTIELLCTGNATPLSGGLEVKSPLALSRHLFGLLHLHHREVFQ